MLWYLYLCAINNAVVLKYQHSATGILVEFEDGSGKFKEFILQPIVTIDNQKYE